MLTEEMINHEFSRAFKGYDIEQVEEYIEKFIGMYEQLANENKELTLRYEQLTKALEDNKETVESAARLGEERERIVEEAKTQGQNLISEAETEAQTILLGAKQKAQGTIENAEVMARRLLTEAKGRAESMDSDAQNVKAAAEEEAARIIAEAKEEAKKLIRATKVNCVKRLDECNEAVEAAKAEHDAIMKKAAAFKAALFEAYSAHILSIENIEIPEPYYDNENTDAGESEKHAEDSGASEDNSEPADVGMQADDTAEQEHESAESDGDAQFAPVFPVILDVPSEAEPQPSEDAAEAQPETFSPPVADTEENGEANELLNYDREENVSDRETNYVFDGGTPKAHKEEKEDKYKSFTGFQIEKEHSGQVQYDSSNITSVNKTLDDIMSKKGKASDRDKTNAYPGKLGFMK